MSPVLLPICVVLFLAQCQVLIRVGIFLDQFQELLKVKCLYTLLDQGSKRYAVCGLYAETKSRVSYIRCPGIPPLGFDKYNSRLMAVRRS